MMSESDTIFYKKAAIFFPSSPSDIKNLELVINILKNKGIIIDIILDNKIGPLPYIWGEDRERANIFKELLFNTDIDIIWCVRGGYGASRWLDIFDWDLLKNISTYPQIVGFSDCTFFFSKLLQYNFTPIHAPLITTFKNTSIEAQNALLKLLHKGEPPLLYGKSLIKGKASGPVIGGNLTCLCHLLATSHEPPWDGAILLIEDHHEALYRIDRMITHLLSAKRLNKLSGIIIGHILKVGMYEDLLPKLLKERLGRLSIPVAYNFPIGHHKDNFPIVLGKRYELNAKGKAAVLKPI